MGRWEHPMGHHDLGMGSAAGPEQATAKESAAREQAREGLPAAPTRRKRGRPPKTQNLVKKASATSGAARKFSTATAAAASPFRDYLADYVK